MSRQSPRVGWMFVLAIGLCLTAAPTAVRAETPAAKRYPFANPPLGIYDQLTKGILSKPEPLSESDWQYLADFWAARAAKPPKAVPPADDNAVVAHLIASGIGEPKTRAPYLKKFNDLVDAAKKATADAPVPAAKADLLLRFLHKDVMAKGYETDQSSLAAVFDTGKFNCVSASCLYYLVGTRLGLSLQPVLIPAGPFVAGHAAVDLIDGKKRVEVEPTSPDGYDWPAKLKRPGVVVIGPRPDRKKAEDSDGFGLAGAIASNRCALFAKSKPAEAIRWAVVALTFAPNDQLAANNMLAAVGGWGTRFGKEGKFEAAIAAYDFGRSALGPVKELEHNYFVTWTHYLDAEFGAGRVAEGVKLVPRAAKAFPKEKSFTNPTAWVIRAAERTAEKDGWTAGLAFADAAAKHLTANDVPAVRGWKDSARRRWSQQLLDKNDVDGSFRVLAAGLITDPDSRELLAGLNYHAQEGLAYLDAKKGTGAAVAHFRELVGAYPKVKGVRDAGFAVASHGVGALENAKKFGAALKAADSYAPLAGDRGDELRVRVYDAWARALAADDNWEGAVQKYVDGLAAHPKSGALRDNAIALVDAWAFLAIDKKEWGLALNRYDVGLRHFPNSSLLKNNRGFCMKQLGK